MGATAALMFMKENPDVNISSVVLDSGFSSLEYEFRGIIENLSRRMGLTPNYKGKIIEMMDYEFHKKLNFHIKDLNPVAASKQCTAPAFFLYGVKDEFLLDDHTNKIFKAYGGKIKKCKKFKGDHLTERHEKLIFEILMFFQHHFQKDEQSDEKLKFEKGA